MAFAVKAAAPDIAQVNPYTQVELPRVEEDRDKVTRGREAVRKSRELRYAKGRRVTYQEVLRKPDDIPLNVAFARTQIRDGNLIGASSTLERILLVAPDNLDVRILYAVVLYRLDNLTEAERELRRVLKERLPDALRAELLDYQNELLRRKRRTNLTILVHNAYLYDTNRNSSPSSGFLDTQFGRVRLFGPDRAVADSAYQGQFRIGLEHDLGFQRQHRLVAAIRGFHGDQARLDQLTLSALDGRVGLILDYNPVTVEPVVSASYILLSHQLYARTIGAGLRATMVVSDRLKLALFGSAEAQNFDGLSESPNEKLRSGAEYRAGGSATYILRTDMRVTLRSLWLRKSAAAQHFSFLGTQLHLEHEYLLGRGAFLLSQFAWEYEQYDGSDVTESAMRRRQHRLRGGATLGVPMSLMIRRPGLLALSRRTTLTAGVEFARSSANITNYTSSNWRFMIGLTISAAR